MDGSNRSDSPLVTMVMLTYNQEKLSLASFESLLAQTYSPLEIIVADDNSSDGTLAALKARAERYSREDNRHSVKVIGNGRNLGVARNCENAMMEAHGELLVTCGGDDISYPERVATIVRKWLESGKKPTVVFHGFRPIDMEGMPLGRKWWSPTLRNPLGFAMAYSSLVVSRFPRITEFDSFEDNVYARRAVAFGEPLFLDDVLADYRVGTGMTSSGAMRQRRKRISNGMVASVRQNLIDLEFVKRDITRQKYDEIKALIDSIKRQYEAEYRMVAGDTTIDRIRGFMQYIKDDHKVCPANVRNLAVYYLPMVFPFLDRVINLMRRKPR